MSLVLALIAASLAAPASSSLPDCDPARARVSASAATQGGIVLLEFDGGANAPAATWRGRTAPLLARRAGRTLARAHRHRPGAAARPRSRVAAWSRRTLRRLPVRHRRDVSRRAPPRASGLRRPEPGERGTCGPGDRPPHRPLPDGDARRASGRAPSGPRSRESSRRRASAAAACSTTSHAHPTPAWTWAPPRERPFTPCSAGAWCWTRASSSQGERWSWTTGSASSACTPI